MSEFVAMTSTMRLLLVCVLAGGLGACTHAAPATPSTPKPPSAESILDTMVQTYAALGSYSDSGRSTTVLPGGATSVGTFTTAFVRPDRFRFEFRDDNRADHAYRIWLSDGSAYSDWYLRPGSVTSDDELAVPIGAAAGVTARTSVLVPSLLLPALGSFTSQLDKPRVTGEPTVGGRPCWQVEADQRTPAATSHMTLLIDRETHALRRMSERVHVKGDAETEAFDAEQTIDYTPRLDAPVHPDALEGPDVADANVDKREPPKWIGVVFERKSTLIKQVMQAGPAAAAGIRTGDIVLSVDGTPVAEAAVVIRRIAHTRAGDVLTFGIDRGGTKLDIPITVALRPEAEALQRSQLLDKPAPDFTLKTLDGKTVTLSQLRGKVVVIDFWATWCGPCLAALPHVLSWHKTLGSRGLAVLGVTDSDPADVQPLVAKHGLDYPIPLDTEHTAWSSYLVQALPTTVVIDKAGVVRFLALGLGDSKALDAAIDGLLKAP